MALTRKHIGKHPTRGDAWWHYDHDASDGTVAVQTGLGSGNVTCADGTVYNVSEEVIEAASLAHAHEIAHLIGEQLEQTGECDVPASENEGVPIPFLHGPCPHPPCGAGNPYYTCEHGGAIRHASRDAEQAHRAKAAKK